MLTEVKGRDAVTNLLHINSPRLYGAQLRAGWLVASCDAFLAIGSVSRRNNRLVMFTSKEMWNQLI